MASKYWIKLYHEILRDPKMGRLPDNVYRRCIELFLLAGETDKDGELPPIPDIAWTLHQTEEALQAEMDHLKQVGILTENEDGVWYVTNFANRQAPVSGADRVREYRKRQREEARSQPETKSNDDGNEGVTFRYTDTDTEKESTTTAPVRVHAHTPARDAPVPASEPIRSHEAPVDDHDFPPPRKQTDAEYARAIDCYTQNVGHLAPITADQFGDRFDEISAHLGQVESGESPAAWFEYAVEEAAAASVYRWSYVDKILAGVLADGSLAAHQRKRNQPKPTMGYGQQNRFTGQPEHASESTMYRRADGRTDEEVRRLAALLSQQQRVAQ